MSVMDAWLESCCHVTHVECVGSGGSLGGRMEFLDAFSHLYKRVCPSVCLSVRGSVCPSVSIKKTRSDTRHKMRLVRDKPHFS